MSRDMKDRGRVESSIDENEVFNEGKELGVASNLRHHFPSLQSRKDDLFISLFNFPINS
jgi:hypothetical protein